MPRRPDAGRLAAFPGKPVGPLEAGRGKWHKAGQQSGSVPAVHLGRVRLMAEPDRL